MSGAGAGADARLDLRAGVTSFYSGLGEEVEGVLDTEVRLHCGTCGVWGDGLIHGGW